MKTIDIDQYGAIALGVFGTLLNYDRFEAKMVERLGHGQGGESFRRWRGAHEHAIRTCAHQQGHGDYIALARNAFQTTVGNDTEMQKIENELMALYRHLPTSREVQDALNTSYRCAIFAVTNAPWCYAFSSLFEADLNERFGKEGLPRWLISAEDVSSFMPNPGVYELFLRRADVPPQKALMMTDSVFVAHGAIDAGMDAVLVRRGPGPSDKTDTGGLPVISCLQEVFRHL